MTDKSKNRFATSIKTNASVDQARHEASPEAVKKFLGGADTHSPTAMESTVTENKSAGSFTMATAKLKANPYDARRYRSQASLNELRADMASNGQNHAIQITPADEDGKHVVIDGRRRWLSTEANGKTEIEVKINHDVDPNDAVALYWHSFFANYTNEKHRDFDDGMAWGIMIDDGKLTLDDIVAKTGKSKSTISQMTCYRKLTQEMLSVIEEDPDKFPYTIAYQLHRLVAKGKNDEAFKLTLAYSQAPTGLRSIQSKVDAILSGQAVQRMRKGRIISNPLDLQGIGSGTIVAYDDGTVQLSMSDVPADKQAEIVKRIQEAMEAMAA